MSERNHMIHAAAEFGTGVVSEVAKAATQNVSNQTVKQITHSLSHQARHNQLGRWGAAAAAAAIASPLLGPAALGVAVGAATVGVAYGAFKAIKWLKDEL